MSVPKTVFLGICCFLLATCSKSLAENARAQVIWEKTFGGSGKETVYSIAPVAGDFLVSGYSSSINSGTKTSTNFGDNDFWLMKIDGNGNKLWEQTYGGSSKDYALQVMPLNDGNTLLAGYSSSSISGNKTNESVNYSYDYWVVKVNSSGTKLWDKVYGGDQSEALYDAVSTSDGGFVLSGISYSSPSGNKTSPKFGGEDFWLVKIDANGNKLWDASYGGTADDRPEMVLQTPDSGYLIGGYSLSGISGNKTTSSFGPSGTPDYWLVKVDANGNKLWDKTFGGSGNDLGQSLVATSDGAYIFGGYSSSLQNGTKTATNYGNYDAWLIKMDSFGNEIWQKTYGGSSNEFSLKRLIADTQGGAIVVAASDSGISGNKSIQNFSNFDYWVFRIDAAGNKLWEQEIGGSGADTPMEIVATKSGYLIGGMSDSGVSGNKMTAAYGDLDVWLVHLSPPAPVLTGSYSQISNSFSLQLVANPGDTNVIHWSSNNVVWMPMVTNIIPPDGKMLFRDAVTTNRLKFYRSESRR